MQGHVDVRQLVVKDYYHPMYPGSLRSVAVFHLPHGLVELDEVPQKLYDELKKQRIAGYELKDTRTVEDMGAGMSGQWVLLTLASGGASGVASALMDKLVAWCASKMTDPTRGNAQVGQSVERASQLIVDHFHPSGPLELLEVELSDGQARVVLEDERQNRFIVETKDRFQGITARKVPGPNEPDFARIDRGDTAP